ncbi:MAG: AMP-binding protein [Gammaproteobacteria bacterium]|nr:AMP-binding protein [Gammaproteobacteria bacterium]
MGQDKSDWVVGKLLARQARERGLEPFVQYEDESPCSYVEADELSNRVGNGFAAAGVEFGERVAVMLNNRLEYLWTWFGLSRIGAVHVGINTALKGSFLTHVLTNAGSRVGVFEREFLPWLADVEPSLPDLEQVWVPGPPLVAEEVARFKRIRVCHFDELLAGSPAPIGVEVSYRNLGMIMYTSGTTGPSKGVLMPHGHLYLFGLGACEHMGLTTRDNYYICMPLFHANALLLQVYGTLVSGGRAVLVKQFRASRWIADIRKYGCNITNSLGVMNDFILAQPEDPRDRDNPLRMMSALPVTVDTLEQLRTRFDIPKFNEIYGMTEVNIPVWRPLDAPDEAGCSGKVWDAYYEVMIADPETDEPLPYGEVGEILVRPKEPFCFMQGYNGMADVTVETWRNFWFHSGDAGRMNEQGFVWYIDRIKDTIRRRGENISSYEVEAVLLEHPAVEEVAAVAVKADLGGEDEVLACIVLKPGQPRVEPEELLTFCLPKMPYFAVPRYIEFVAEIPKTPSQKMQKNRLRERGITAATWDREAADIKVRRS